MNNLKNEPVFPVKELSFNTDGIQVEEKNGLTKRQYFALHMQTAIISNADSMREIHKSVRNSFNSSEIDAAFFKTISKIAVKYADALIEALNE